MDKNTIYVDSNSILSITIPSSSSYSSDSTSIIINDDIKNSKVIEFLGIYSDNCDPKYFHGCPIGGRSYLYYRFFIKEVKDENELPKLQNKNGVEYTLKLKSSCSLNGYRCCSKANAKVIYQDKDGDWSVENGDWCFINKEKTHSSEAPELIRTCEANLYNQPCCTYEQMEELGINLSNNQSYFVGYEQCGKPLCIYTGEYPICESTRKVVYTDTEKWGVENNQWCVMCQ